MQQPTRLISTPFAQEGEKTEIQNVTGEFDNSATYRLGFPPLTMQSIRSGGKPPKGTDFNGVLFDITENISFLCKGGRYQYNAGLSTLIGGYPEGSNLLLDDNVTEVVSTVAGNQNNPNTNMTGWTFKPNKTTAVNVADASGETQQQVNYNGGSKWHSRVGGYKENERVVLANGDIVKSTVDGNTNDPNVNMTWWVNPKLEQEKKNNETVSTADYGSIGDGSAHTIREWIDSGKYKSLDAIQIKYPHVTSLENSIDWVAAQKACNTQKKGGSVKIVGCLFFKQGEKLVTKAAQYIYGQSPSYFLNTNNGVKFTGALTGDLPEYGIYYDGTTGAALRCGAGTTLANMHIFGKGYIDDSGAVDILDVGTNRVHNTVGIEVEKFIITNCLSVYYFGKAFNHVLGGGDYYSRYFATEVTRCNEAYAYDETAYNQHFYGCIIRNTPTPFFFNTGVACRTFNYFGGSIEGYRPVDANIYAIGVPANSIMRFNGTYFENLDKSSTFEAVFGFKGGNCFLQFDGCTVYANHYKAWVKQTAYTQVRVKTSGNEFYLSQSSRIKDPIIYDLLFVKGSSYLYSDGTDKINFSRGYPNKTVSGSIAVGSTALTVSDVVDLYVGQRVIVKGSQNLETVVTAINGNVLTLRNKAKIDYSGAVVEVYYTSNYIAPSLGLNLLNNADIHYPDEYLPQFDSVKFNTTPGEVRAALSDAPGRPFNAQNSGLTTYVADYANWNPSGKSDGRGAYPVAYRGGKYYPQLGSFTGSFTCSSGSVTIVNDTNVSASSVVLPVPRNAAAANLLKNGYYISETSNSTRFSITFLTSAVGTEKFDYTITD